MSSSFAFRRIGVVAKPGLSELNETVITLIELLLEEGLSVNVSDDCTLNHALPASVSFVPREHIGQNVDLVIVVGGDGSLLDVARKVNAQQTPLLGVNRGRLGFLTDINPGSLGTQIPPILRGEYREEPRVMLQAKVMREGALIAEASALNDVVLYSGDIARMIEFEVVINGQFVYRQRSDGLITATPTGSTAYALSGGGPIMHPQLPALVLVPMHPHTLSARPIVVHDESHIVLRVSATNHHFPKISCDGQIQLNTQPLDEIHIQKLPNRLRLIHPLNHDYFAMLRTKLGWGGLY